MLPFRTAPSLFSGWVNKKRAYILLEEFADEISCFRREDASIEHWRLVGDCEVNGSPELLFKRRDAGEQVQSEHSLAVSRQSAYQLPEV